jgi:hypothetical protein
MVLVVVQVGDFMSTVIGGEWWKVKKRYLGLLLKKMKGENLKGLLLGLRMKGNGLASCGAKERRTRG